MASLIVAGDTSGTVTLQAPAIAGSTVLTLPTTSGTLVTTAGGTTVPFALGSAASPSITFTGDTNTGIFSPGADTIGFAEGGAEVMRLDSVGNLGLGITPSAWGTSTKALELGGSINNYLAFNNSSVSGSYLYWNMFYDGTNNKYKSTGVANAYGVNSTGAHLWFNAASGTAGNNVTLTQAMTLDASGRLGIGTTSPSQRLSILNGGTYGTIYQPAFIIGNDSSGGNVGLNTGLGAIVWATDGLGTQVASIEAIRQNPGAGAASALAFRTGASGGGTERMRINSGGDLLLGTTTATAKVSISGVGGTAQQSLFADGWGSGIGAFATLRAANTSNADVIYFETSAAGVGKIAITSTSTSYVTSSDYRLKENIAPMTGALATVQALKPVTYTWKVDGSDGQGFIAHELQAVVPDCVTGEKDAVETYTDEDGVEQTRPKYQGIDTSFLVATLTAAIQEQQAIIQSQADTITAMEVRLTALENK